MRVPRTFVFADLTGFTNYTAENGDEEAARLLALFRTAVREVASARGVRIAKWLGDGCMIVSVDQEAAIAAALDMELHAIATCTPLTLRIGLATGYALLFEGDDYIGSAVNLASRLCDAAGPGEVYVPRDVISDVPEGVVMTWVGPVHLPGFPEPIDVVELSGAVAQLDRDDTEELWTRSPFVA